jgi:hypothetical protein
MMTNNSRKFAFAQSTPLHVSGASQYGSKCLEILSPNHGCEILHADDDFQQSGYSGGGESKAIATKHFPHNISNVQWIRETFTDNDLVAGSSSIHFNYNYVYSQVLTLQNMSASS